GRGVPGPRALHPGLSRDPREEGGEVDITASVSTFWRTFKVAAWLGWEMDSNWTEPWLFIIYSIVKPIAAVFILVLMYVVFAAIGITLGGATFLMARHTQTIAEAVPGIFYVFCGVLFPLSVLPGGLSDVGKVIPLTYWFDLSRRLLLPSAELQGIQTGLGGFSDLTILAFLAISSVAFFGLSIAVFKAGEYLAR